MWQRTRKNVETYKRLSKVSLVGFLAELPNLIATLITCFLTASLIVWVDFFRSLESTLHYGIVWIVSDKLQNDLSDQYNYGVDRVEVFASLICDTIVCLSLIGVSIYSVIQFFHVQAPSDNLLIFLILKAVNISFDVYFVTQQLIIRKKGKSRVNETELASSAKYLADDVVTAIVAVICFLFRDVRIVWYLSPAFGLAISIYFILSCTRRLKRSLYDLTDRALAIPVQDKILDTLLEYRGCYRRINAINSREINNTVQIDLEISFFDDTTYRQEMDFLDQVKSRISERIKDCRISLVLNQDAPAKDEYPREET